MSTSPQRRALFPPSHWGSPTSEGTSRSREIPHLLTTLSATAREDSVNSTWSTYMKEAGEYDKLVADGWKEDANYFLAFSGLVSATVTAFLIEGIKKLSPDSGDRNSFYLSQISQQLAGSANGTNVPLQIYPSPSPNISIVLVNTMWLLSLVLSVMSALSAAMIQQWARRYVQLPRIPGPSSDQARVRSFLFFGACKYGMINAVELTPALFHLSVSLFLAGLIIYLFTINKTVAIILTIFVGLFGLAYLVLTILPCIDRRCPYRTPLTSVL
ncbi:hypothetical protein BC826DRAFT_921487, partial [Russula brevipes]